MRGPLLLTACTFLAISSVRCIEPKVTSFGGPTLAQAQAEPYNGPKARIAVAQFEDTTGKGKLTGAIGDGMADMLATALFHSNRFIVLERAIMPDILTEQDLVTEGRIKRETGAPIGQIEGAELLIRGSVTEFEPGSAGVGGGVAGGKIPDFIGAAISSITRSHIALDIRIVDTRTSRVVAATSVEASATDFNLAGLLVGRHAGGGLGRWSKTPVEKAIRLAIQKAVDSIVQKTPDRYFHYGASPAVLQPAAHPTPADPVQNGPSTP